jgi:hypothetical protein
MDFKSARVRASCHADQALEAARFFTVIGTPEAANCLQFAATRLKFAARPLVSAAGRRACSLSPSTGVRFRLQ